MSTYFAESYFTTNNSRLFNISINGAVVRADLDVYATAPGKNVALILLFTEVVPVAGHITIAFTKVKQNPFVNAISVVGEVTCPSVTPSVSASASPSASAVPAVSPCVNGRSPDSFSLNVAGPALPASGFGADNTKYIKGSAGFVSVSNAAVQVAPGATNADVYLTERYTTERELTYHIPVPEGNYTVTTYHAESYFNTNASRVFNIVINGEVVKADLDVHATAGGKDIALVQDFINIPSVNGSISISFTKVTENPFVNGVKISGPGADTLAVGSGCPATAPVRDPKPLCLC